MASEPLEVSPRSQAQVVLEVTTTIVIMICAIFGNSLVCLAVYRTRRLRTIPNTFVVNLAATDLLLVSTVLPVVIQTQFRGVWSLGAAYCELQGFQSIYLFAVSLFTLASISINRYFKIVRRESYDAIFHKKSVVAMLVAIWGIAALLCMGPFVGWGRYAFDGQKALCSSDDSSVSFRATATVVIIGNMVAILACNIMISVSVKKHRLQIQPRGEIINQERRVPNGLDPQKKLQVDESICIASRNVLSYQNPGAKHPRVARVRRETRGEDVHIARTISLVVLLFFLSWLPNLILDILVQAGVHVTREVRMFGVYAVFLDSVINPVIYGVKNRGFRQAFKEILRCSS